jgi:hypothetical protein
MLNNRSNYQGYQGNKVSISNGRSDFENYATSPAGLLKIKILESRAYVIDCISNHTKAQASKANLGVIYIKTAINDLFLQIRSMLKSDYEKTKEEDNVYLMITKKKESNNVRELIEVFELMDDYLLKKKITRIDYIDNYDRTLVTEEDERSGL